MKYWLHRITGGDNALGYAYPLLFKHNFLSIGWSDFSTETFLKNVIEKGAEAIDNDEEMIRWGRPRSRWNLWRFIKGMEKGDIIVVPTWGEFSLFEIEDDKIFSNETMDLSIYQDRNGNQATLNEDGYFYNSDGKIIDLGFYRKVKPILTNIPRNGYADQDLYSRMKIRQTNAEITDLKESIEFAREAFEKNKPINLKEQIIEETAPNILALIDKLSNADKFEELVGCYLESLGARVETPSKNESKTEEGDADKVGYFDNIKTAIMVQVKKHKGTTDNWAVQQIRAFKKNHNYGDYNTQMWVISSCKKFSEDARIEAESNGVRLIDGNEFAKMLLNTGLEGITL